MRVVMVLEVPPTPEGGAASRHAIALLRALVELGVDCRALAACARPAEVPDDLPVELVPLEIPVSWSARWQRVVHPGGRLAIRQFADEIRRRAAGADVLHLEELQAGALLGVLDVPTVVQLHCLTARDRRLRLSLREEDRVTIEFLRAERRVRRKARWLLANSSAVGDELARKARHANVSVVPLALDPVYYQPRATLAEPLAGLIGTAAWPPTANAVDRLLGQVWPRVLERRPDARLVLAGRGMEPDTFPAHAGTPGVEWRGAVESAAELLRELAVLLYPLGAGSGTKVKVLEALALGVPVVTTPEGAEGLGALDGVVVESSDEAIADAAAALLADVDGRRAAGELGYQNFLRHHTPRVAAERMVEVYERMIGAARP